MTSDPSIPPSRGRFHWLRGILRSRGGRPTRVEDLPPHLLDDIGLNRHFVDVTLRHRR
jgi:hypothetical protein